MTGRSVPVPQVTRVGKALALFRARVQRFTDDRASHALASELEARYVDGLIPSPATIGSLERYLQALREQPSPPFDASEVAKIEGVDLEQAVAQRECWRAATRDTRAARVVVVVVGSPRSGSSYLYNLLATQPGIATFTSVSSPYWSTFDLVHPRG